ncbi:MAG TPA: hypothetical protein VM677_22785 [Actinokineospora sp.]|nr:hypothetical protein [Actinokineospora sp.]
MLAHIEIEATVKTDPQAHFYWKPQVEFSHDCFVCRRRGRTVLLDTGWTEGRCASGSTPVELASTAAPNHDKKASTHPAPIRLVAFDTAQRGDGLSVVQTLRCRVTSWWSPFHDITDPAQAGAALTERPWVRLAFGLGCTSCFDDGDRDPLNVPGTSSIQTNLVWPSEMRCPKCARVLVTTETSPRITLVA